MDGIKIFTSSNKKEASYFDQINRTENWLEYDRKIITQTNMNDGTWPKHYTDEP